MIATIFDMDGVLVKNAHFHERAFLEYFSQYGIVLEPEMHGRGNNELMKELFPNKSDEERQQLSEEKEAYYRKIYSPHIKPAAGLIELLNSLKKEKVLIAVGSSAPQVNIDFVLDRLNIRKYFDAIIGAAIVKQAKPAPDIYLKAAEVLNVTPSNCLVFEDAIAGIESAKAAGMKVVGLATTLPKEKLKNTDCIIDDFTQISFNKIKQLIS